eukprot:5695339-Pyramimonas_sp.AAC.1
MSQRVPSPVTIPRDKVRSQPTSRDIMLDCFWGSLSRGVLTRSPASIPTTSKTAADLIHGIAVDLSVLSGSD